MRYQNERSIISSIYTRLAVDAAAIQIRHVRLDDNDRYKEDIQSDLNECLKVQPNMDQGPRHFRQDIINTLIDKGAAAIVPVETTLNPMTGSFDIRSMRVGEIVGWMPERIRVRLYRESLGQREEVEVEKKICAIIENPFYSVMNEPNSTLQRLIRKLNQLDQVDEQSSSGKLDIIIQVPYSIKSESLRQRAEQRRVDIEHQLSGSKYGIAYTDGTEKITQLNRPAENNLLKQVEYLTKLLFSQLGLTEEIMNGTADEATMLNYTNRTIMPFVEAIVEAMTRSFLTKTARTQKQSILFFRDPFKLVSMEKIADIADKFIRGEIASPNDMRQAIGWKPSGNPKSDELRNTNMPLPPEEPTEPPSVGDKREPVPVGAGSTPPRKETRPNAG